jgi:hypothetical protein
MVTLIKKTNQKTMCFSCFIPLVKVNILLVNVNILVKLNILKSHGFFVVIRN